jgi:hypothetical protein
MPICAYSYNMIRNGSEERRERKGKAKYEIRLCEKLSFVYKVFPFNIFAPKKREKKFNLISMKISFLFGK